MEFTGEKAENLALYQVVNCFQNTILVWNSQVVCTSCPSDIVVNCFQNTILVWNSQVTALVLFEVICCELLSEYYLSMEFTGVRDCIVNGFQL